MRGFPTFSLALSAMILSACGSGMNTNVSQMNPVPPTTMTLMMRDTPPAGVPLLRFEITVTGASLLPMDMNMMPVSLLNAPVKVELEKLETETGILSTASIAPGTYSSIMVTFANPEMTILNESGQTLTVSGKMCDAGTICELEPQLSPASVTVSSAPFPLVLNMNSHMGLLLDFNVNASVQNNLSVDPSVSFTQVNVNGREGELEELDDVIGVVATVGNDQVMLDNLVGMQLTINVDSNTEFEFEGACMSNNFSCVMRGQVLNVDLIAMLDGTLIAKKVELEVEQNDEVAEGVVTSVSAGSNQFQIVVTDDEPMDPNVPLGEPITVQVAQGAKFEVDIDEFSGAKGLTIESIRDVIVGQEIQIRPTAFAMGTPITITTDRVRLRTGQIPGTVASVAVPNFVLSNLSGLFTSAGIMQIQVDTSQQTNYDGLGGVESLMAGNQVAVRGLLFGTGSGQALVAAKIRERAAPD